jgi:5-methylcytosine-specific restriction endonuclease McrBC regulatory subunit McrC
MMNVFNGMVKKMKDGGGVSFDFDLTQGDNEEVLPTTLERRDNEDEDEESDERSLFLLFIYNRDMYIRLFAQYYL